jgi:hypothetical protein
VAGETDQHVHHLRFELDGLAVRPHQPVELWFDQPFAEFEARVFRMHHMTF